MEFLEDIQNRTPPQRIDDVQQVVQCFVLILGAVINRGVRWFLTAKLAQNG